LLLAAFYLTDFNLVGYIPKAAFSSMLVLSFIDMIDVWALKSYFKTKEKMEWLVVPLIVVLAFVVGLLQSVFLGLAMSTFLFVASFFRSGVVKYVSNGINIRSTIERPTKVTKWLDKNADQIQILVLQNYLFFGNASSILSYITSMFEETSMELDFQYIPPKPKIVVLDLTLVTGMDTSAVDVFSDISYQCKKNDCKLFLSGVATPLRQVMSLCGVKPDNTNGTKGRHLRFFLELDAAIGKAEDLLIDLVEFDDDTDGQHVAESGFRRALEIIDEEHSTNVRNELINLEEHAEVIEVEAGDIFYRDSNDERGLFFIEHGIIVSFAPLMAFFCIALF
jgi:sulfate permease, SulP family